VPGKVEGWVFFYYHVAGIYLRLGCVMFFLEYFVEFGLFIIIVAP